MRSICSFGLSVGPMKQSDRRYATLIDSDGQVSNKTENKKRGFSSRLQYHIMLSVENENNKKYKEKSISSHKLTYENTVSHISIPKYKRYYITETAMEMVCNHFKELIPDWFRCTENLKACSNYYSGKKHHYAWRPIAIGENLPGMNIYYTLVNRFDYCKQLLNKYPDISAELAMSILEIQDSYILLMLHMQMKCTFTDEELEYDDMDSAFPPPVKLYDPASGAPFKLEELPDILPYIPYISFWSDKDGISTDNLLIKRLLFLLYKCLPYPYKRRSVENAIVESWSDLIQRVFLKDAGKNDQEKERMEYERQFTGDIYQITIRIVLCSLLGRYEHNKIRANDTARFKILKWFCLNRPNQEQMSMWIIRYKEVVLCSFREFLFYMCDKIGGLPDFLGKISYWNLLKYDTYVMMDNARNQINNSIDNYHKEYSISERGMDNLWNDLDMFYGANVKDYRIFGDEIINTVTDDESFEWFPGISWFYKIQKDLDSVNRNMLKNANRPKTHTFEDMGLLKMDEVEAEKKKHKQINKISIEPDFLEERVKNHIKNVLKGIHPFVPISYTMLGDIPIKFNSKFIKRLQEAEDSYELEEGASSLKDVLSLLYSYHSYEYQVLKFYFKEIVKKRNLLVYYTSKDIYEAQVKTLERIYETQPGGELSSSAGLYYVCTNCNNIKITVRDVSPLNNPDSIGGWTSEGVCINLGTGHFYCTKMSSKENPKKRNTAKNIIKEMFPNDMDDITKDVIIDNTQALQSLAADSEDEEEHQRKKPPEYEENDVKPQETNNNEEPSQGLGSVKRTMDLEDLRELRSYVNRDEKTILDKYITKRTLQEECLNTRLSPVYLAGTIIKTSKGAVMGCPHCMHPVYYSREMFRNGIANMSCGCKDRKTECDFNCYICNKDCHDYCFIKAIWDDSALEGLRSDTPLVPQMKYVSLCEAHRNKWTSDLSHLPKYSQLNDEHKSIKLTMIKGQIRVENIIKEPEPPPVQIVKRKSKRKREVNDDNDETNKTEVKQSSFIPLGRPKSAIKKEQKGNNVVCEPPKILKRNSENLIDNKKSTKKATENQNKVKERIKMIQTKSKIRKNTSFKIFNGTTK